MRNNHSSQSAAIERTKEVVRSLPSIVSATCKLVTTSSSRSRFNWSSILADRHRLKTWLEKHSSVFLTDFAFPAILNGRTRLSLIDRSADARRTETKGGFLEERLLDTSCFLDRKSTRLNSSHANISYAVFCLKKK